MAGEVEELLPFMQSICRDCQRRKTLVPQFPEQGLSKHLPAVVTPQGRERLDGTFSSPAQNSRAQLCPLPAKQLDSILKLSEPDFLLSSCYGVSTC